jgi:hypothetical protein
MNLLEDMVIGINMGNGEGMPLDIHGSAMEVGRPLARKFHDKFDWFAFHAR